MYLMYIDESGDCGLTNSPTRYFVLSGLVIHELRWRTRLNDLIALRQRLRQSFGIKLREEFHAACLINTPGPLVRIKRHDRLAMIRTFTDALAAMSDINIINIVIDKNGKTAGYDAFTFAWKTLIQRFENTITHHNFPGPSNSDDKGLIFCDHTDDKKLMLLLRQMRHYNPVPQPVGFRPGYRQMPIQYIIEDPSFRDSEHSYFIQAVDLAAFLLYQRLAPSAYMRKHAGHNYFIRLKPVLCSAASSSDPDGIVRL